MDRSLVTTPVAAVMQSRIPEPIIHRVLAFHETEFPPIAAVETVWQEHLAAELVTVVRDSIRRLIPRHRRRSFERSAANAA